LKLNNNKIEEIKPLAFSGLEKLVILDLKTNSIKNIELNVFDMKSLKDLTLSYNSISEISPGAFLNLTQLGSLVLSFNKLDNFSFSQFEGLQNLEYLAFTGNFITELPPETFKALKSLKSLMMWNNNIKELSSDSIGVLPDLEGLYIGEINLRKVDPGFFCNFPKLSLIDARRNVCIDELIIEFTRESIKYFDKCMEPVIENVTCKGEIISTFFTECRILFLSILIFGISMFL